MNYQEAYRLLKRRFPNRQANVCHETVDGKYVFCFSPVPSELDGDGIAQGLICYSVDKFTGKTDSLCFQDVIDLRMAFRHVLN